jgi:hypothetical protein
MVPSSPLIGATGTAFMGRDGSTYNDIWNTQMDEQMPRTMPDALRFSQSVHMLDGTYHQAMKRVASYFVTDPEVSPYSNSGDKKLSSEEKQKYVDFLEKTLRIRSTSHEAAVNLLVYGVVFMSLQVPFKRYLSCPCIDEKTGHKCGYEAPLEKICATDAYAFKWSEFQFSATCPACKYKGVWNHIDRRGDCETDLRVHFWNPMEIELIDDPITDSQSPIWKIPEYLRRLIKEGKPFHLCRANWEVIQAVKRGDHLLFDPGVIHYMRQKPLHGIYSGGWGLSSAITNFRQAASCQMLRRFNEAICQDFIVPFRVLSPEPKTCATPESSDPVLGGQGGYQFRNNMQRMVRAHRRDPNDIQISPYPVHYQMLGGEANTLAPFQLIDQATDALLNAAGVPAELYKGTLTMQAAPAALRLFESHWSPLVEDLNRMLEWIVDRASKILKWEPVDAKFQKVRTADDMNRQMAVLQLMMSRGISQETGLKNIGIDFKTEQDQLLAEQTYIAEKTQEAQEEQQAKATQQGMVPGVIAQAQGQGQQQPGQPPQAGATAGQPQQGGPTTVEDIQAQADQIVQQLEAMPDSQRKSELLQLKKDDSTLHALVSSKLDENRRRQNTAGGAQIRGQQQQQAQQPQGQPQGQPGPQMAKAAALPSMGSLRGVFGGRKAG